MTNPEKLEKLCAVLSEFLPDCDFTTNARFESDHVMGSLDSLVVLYALEVRYGVKVPAGEIIPEDLDSLESIQALIEKYQVK